MSVTGTAVSPAHYLYVSSGGCATCDWMEGLYDAEPGRPHPNCRCQIVAVEDETTTAPASGEPGDWDRKGDGWQWVMGTVMRSEDRDGDGYQETYVPEGELYVFCCDGTTVLSEDFVLEVTVDLRSATTHEEQDALIEEAMKEAEQKAANRARRRNRDDCQPCQDNTPRV